ncbi:type II toxin-antitoxin system HicB family antitoxin [Desulfoscipio sp. XC116]|uniref:type II toxin-antitoxin system HicB family antitoxin n=1 Tax=Desulfoscipio sp. XC116 TaxID=3144975 RepID=UPI00325BC676
MPSLPGCITEGDTIQEVPENAHEAIKGYLEALKLQVARCLKRIFSYFTGKLRFHCDDDTALSSDM